MPTFDDIYDTNFSDHSKSDDEDDFTIDSYRTPTNTPNSSQPCVNSTMSTLTIKGDHNPVEGNTPWARLSASQIPSQNSHSRSQGLYKTKTGKGELSANAIADLIANLADIPEYVRKLERRRVAAERSNESKKERIQELERQVKSLTARLRALQEERRR